MKIKKVLVIIALILVVFLDVAALDDITTGLEPGFIGEYIVLAVSVPLIAAAVYYLRTS